MGASVPVVAMLSLSSLVLVGVSWPVGPSALQLELVGGLRCCFVYGCTRGHLFPGADVGEDCFHAVETQESVPGYQV